jgi:hypothetical protein
LDENFNDEPYEEDEDNPIDINEEEVGEIDIHTITLPRNRQC